MNQACSPAKTPCHPQKIHHPPRHGHHPRLTLHVGYALPRRGIPAPPSFRQWVEATLRGVKRRRASELCIRIVAMEEGRTFNHNYRSKNKATNVLSFAIEASPGPKLPLIGDLVLCAPVVASEAAAQGKPERAHWAHLTVHGTLHLLGYDHIEDSQAKTMEALEIRILADLSITNPYLS